MNKTSRTSKLNIKRLAIACAVVMLLAICFAVCASCSKSVKLSGISAVYNGSEVEVGGTLNKDDIVVTASYTDNTSKVVTNYSVIYDTSSTGEKTVFVVYVEGKIRQAASFAITVVEPESPTPPVPVITLESITATYNGESIEVGGTLNNDDIAVTAHYSDDTSKNVTSFTTSGFASDTAGEKSVTVTYVEETVTKTCTVTITVVEPEPPSPPVPTVTLESITATYKGESIKVGGKLNNDDIAVTAHYSDDTSKNVTSFTTSGFASDTAGEKSVTVTYVEETVTKTCTVTITVVEPEPPSPPVPTVTLESITATYNGESIEVGGTLNNADIAVTAHYSDETSKNVTSFTTSGFTSDTAGEKSVTVTYVEDNVTKTCTVTITVVEPEPPSPPVPTVTLESITATYNGESIKVGGTLNNADIAVTAHYSDETSKPVTGFTTSGFASDTAGEKSVTVTYVEETVTKTCTVTITVVEPEPPSPPNPPIPPEPAVTLESITATYNGENIKVGGKLNNDDIAVTAYYSNDTSKPVTNFAVGGFSSAKAGTQTVNVSYTEGGIIKECTVNIIVIENGAEVADYGKYGILQDDGSVKITNTAIVNNDLQIHFLAFENVTPGDCVYIKAGQTDILIDAGSTKGSATTIDKYIKNYCTDGVLEFVIATHADSDHISGFVGNGSNGIMDKYECQTIIKYTQSNKNTEVKNDFETKCQQQADNNNAKVFTALQCWNESEEGAKRVYKLSDNIEMELLYHKYYNTLSSDENNQSVCVMIHQYGDGYDFDNKDNANNVNYVNHYLFTGDLEKEGEESLVEKNPNLPEVVLFKGGHHGSATSSNETLLNMIKPKLVCVCTCCDDTTTYKFPRQEFIDRVAKHTDMLFLTNTRTGKSTQYVHLNGNITVTSNSDGVFVNCSNNNTLFKDTDWFKNNRTCPPEWETTSN